MVNVKMPFSAKLKGKDRLETIENYSIFFIFIGAIAFSAGIILGIASTKGFSAILAMLGALVSFLSTVSLIAVWVMREFEKEPAEANS